MEYTVERATQMPQTDSITGLSFPTIADETRSAEPSEIERDVMELFDQLRNPLLRYAHSFGIPMHDAEEVVQETFLSLFRHLQLGRPRKSLRGWIFRVAHNLALKQRHTHQRLCEVTVNDEAMAERQLDNALNPEQQLSFGQRQSRLLAVVAILPEADRSCLCLRAEGLRYREIAAVLGISLGSVSISLKRSLARLMRAEGR
jgi:RNA polymerase sigma-70 factor, ECF subfamily